MNTSCIKIGKLVIHYRKKHDLLGIVENFVLDVYGANKISKDAVVFDFGAGIGDFTILVANKLKEGKVIAVEPNPNDFEVLQTNLRQNGITNVLAFNYAIGKRVCKTSMEFAGEVFEAQVVDFSTLWELVKLSQSEEQRLCFIKVDIEGAETELVECLTKHPVFKYISTIAIELHGTMQDIDRLLVPEGFRFRRLKRIDYLKTGFTFSLRHPLLTKTLWNEVRKYLNISYTKIMNGIEITSSKNLVIGS